MKLEWMAMAVSKDEILSRYVAVGLPIPFKTLQIHPIQVKDAYLWLNNMHILTVEKEYMNDVDIIQMSYLRFLLEWGQSQPEVIQQLGQILYMCLQMEDYLIDIAEEDGKFYIILAPQMEVSRGYIPDYSQAIKISETEFDEFRRLVLIQNIREWDDEYVTPEVKQAMDEYYELVSRKAVHVEMERKVAAVISQTGLSIQEIQQMPYRMFQIVYEAMVDRIDYQICKQAEMNGAEFKKPIEHWVNREAHDKYKDAFVDYDTMESKLK